MRWKAHIPYLILTTLILAVVCAWFSVRSQARENSKDFPADILTTKDETPAPAPVDNSSDKPNPESIALERALQRYREIANRGGWLKPPGHLAVKKGESSGYVFWLRNYFGTTGDMTADEAASTSPVFDDRLEAAIRRFEERHALVVDGVLDAKLISVMSIPVETRIAQLEANLDRWKQWPADFGRRHIRVNIPEFRLDAIEDGKSVLTMGVVVGKTDSPTPSFGGKIQYIVLSPYWNVPPSIARQETLPLVMKDPTYLSRHRLEVVARSGRGVEVLDPTTMDWSENYSFRQRPGPGNSLGLVKFMFPNKHNVYLHDTPADSLFKRPRRAFSHGCVRLEKPMELARYVLRDQPRWTDARLESAARAGQERVVTLNEPLPVYLLYWTAFVRADGTVHFREDVYGLDRGPRLNPNQVAQAVTTRAGG